MILIILIILSVKDLGLSSELTKYNLNITSKSLHNICKNEQCIENGIIQSFCERLYETVFQCESKNIPHSHVCDGIYNCMDAVDEHPIICNLFSEGIPQYEDKCKVELEFQDDLFRKYPVDSSSRENIFCPYNFKDRHIVFCYINYEKLPIMISCKENIPSGAIAEVRCKAFYTSRRPFQKMLCQNNGKWNQKALECKEACGDTAVNYMDPLIVNGAAIEPTLWPWYAALFTMKNKKWSFFCSSTIISRNMVLTAAHCVWKIDKRYLKVTAGKYYSNFYTVENNCQVANVADIMVHPLYQDSVGNFMSDIAIIVLQKAFVLSKEIRPICLNLSLRFNPLGQDKILKGMVVGMGVTENKNISSNLRATPVRIIKNIECVNNQREEFKKYVTVTSFCAGNPNTSSLCNGDSGSGLAVKHRRSGKWILEGIVSISPKNLNSVVCKTTHYTIFTNVGMYSNWIHETLTKNSIE